MLRRLSCRRSLLITPDGRHHLVLTHGNRSVEVVCEGLDLLGSGITLRFQIDGLSQLNARMSVLETLRAITQERPSRFQSRPRPQILRLRDGLIALDGSLAGASYREIAEVIHGKETTREAWRSASRSLKDKLRRDVKRGRVLMEGGYRKLLK